MYIVINKFLVQSKHRKDFVKETKTIWFKAYKKSPGFIKSLIIQNRQNPNEFLTVDMWKSKNQADRFFKQNLDKLSKVSNVPKRYVERKSFNQIEEETKN